MTKPLRPDQMKQETPEQSKRTGNMFIGVQLVLLILALGAYLSIS